jgi:uncharacterized protein YfkK (UPF0435 family)
MINNPLLLDDNVSRVNDASLTSISTLWHSLEMFAVSEVVVKV